MNEFLIRIGTAFLPIMIALFAVSPALAQGTQGDYERAASLSQRYSKAFSQRTVTPRWLPGSNAFWYRVETGPERAEFVFVDALKGERRAAFDHAALAAALSRETKTEVSAGKLPFSWIQIAPDGSWARFRIKDTVWQFKHNGTLHRSSEPLEERRLEPFSRLWPSREGGAATAIVFVNRTKEPVTLFWIDSDGEAHRYQTVAPGEFLRRETYVGHTWQVKSEQGESLGIFQAVDDETQAVVGETTNVKSHTEPKTPPPPKIEAEAAPAPRHEAFVRDHNLWLRETNGKELQLTTNGTAENFYREPLRASPDGRFLVASQVRPAQEHKVYIVESSPKDQIQPKLKTIDYLKPGDRIEQERPRLFDLQDKRETPTSDALFQNPWNIEGIGWSEDGQHYRFLFNQRGHQRLRVLDMDTQGQMRTIVDEKSDTFIDYSQKTYLHQVEGRPELIWASERDGWNHLYLYDANTEQVKNQITKGSWVMREVVRVDDEKRQIWFRAFGIVPGQDPYYAHLARINFDGSGLAILTEGDATHSWKLSPDNRFFLDTYSRVDMAPVTELRDAQSGKKICELELSDMEPLKNAGWTVPERFKAMGRDGKTPIYGVIIRPSNFDPAKKYPVIEQIYAGPQDFFTPKGFGLLTGIHQLAELGFIVVQMDGMGTNWRSKSFHDVCWKNLKDAGFPDRIAWMKAAAQTRPWMDLSRVGIYGGSAGGQNALGALLFHGDFYKAAAADCGCHDNRMDKIWWNEAWMGWPVDKSYEDSSNVVHAANLRGKLLLIVGELDTNVDPASTMQVVNALIKADKDFELLVVPGAGHGAGSSAYGTRRQRDFFVRHLLGVEPPNRNAACNEKLNK
jgi:dipeptidyl aminopeptidase/acylaminoacyl peptidase